MTLATDHPDWSTIAQRIACPLCDYELRGLVEPRCPECGGQFEWGMVLNPDRQTHPFLFEHHPKRNFWSFFKTKLAGLSPAVFWRTLRPAQISRPGRLVLYWLISSLLLLAFLLGDFALHFYPAAQTNQQQRANFIKQVTPQMRPVIDRYLPPTFSFAFLSRAISRYVHRPAVIAKIFVALLYISWPWLTFAALLVFQISMRRARVRPIHVLRCAIYSCDWTVLVGLALTFFISDSWYRFTRVSAYAFSPAEILATFFAFGFAIVTLGKLYFAYRYYLPFSHPLATTVASQLVALLTALVLASILLPY